MYLVSPNSFSWACAVLEIIANRKDPSFRLCLLMSLLADRAAEFLYLPHSNHGSVSWSKTQAPFQWKWHLTMRRDIKFNSCLWTHLSQVFFLFYVKFQDES